MGDKCYRKRAETLVPIKVIKNNNINIGGITCQNHNMVMRHAVAAGSGNFNHLLLLNMHWEKRKNEDIALFSIELKIIDTFFYAERSWMS